MLRGSSCGPRILTEPRIILYSRIKNFFKKKERIKNLPKYKKLIQKERKK